MGVGGAAGGVLFFLCGRAEGVPWGRGGGRKSTAAVWRPRLTRLRLALSLSPPPFPPTAAAALTASCPPFVPPSSPHCSRCTTPTMTCPRPAHSWRHSSPGTRLPTWRAQRSRGEGGRQPRLQKGRPCSRLLTCRAQRSVQGAAPIPSGTLVPWQPHAGVHCWLLADAVLRSFTMFSKCLFSSLAHNTPRTLVVDCALTDASTLCQ